MSRDEIAAVTAQINELLAALSLTVRDLKAILAEEAAEGNGAEEGVHERHPR